MYAFSGGIRAALPIAIAYLPVAFALGAAASRLGFSVVESVLWSLTMFSGANQALMLSAISSGVSLVILTLLSIAASLRHALYGIALSGRIEARPATRATFAYGLTDEVFATVLSAADRHDRPLAGSWLVGLAMTVLAVWVIGTGLGNAAGDVLQALSPAISEALDFALPALFLALVLATLSRKNAARMAVAALIAAAIAALGRPELAIPAGAVAAFIPVRGEV